MNSVIITAAGLGKRMGTQIPKQFLPINGLPVLMHTIQLFHDYDPEMELILTFACRLGRVIGQASSEEIQIFQNLNTVL